MIENNTLVASYLPLHLLKETVGGLNVSVT